ncbi:hypothetical protein [Steroidobacter sp.]|uniref:hypothetical protein n=1 Tax=Steroidobacter sp. TaxID=1978227 RepID=UPI001A3D6CBE|nr:hypothetical protein [Steroidobacter sp.]MBL8269749.1 hypothetical protein [Steroidobacter sp.]
MVLSLIGLIALLDLGLRLAEPRLSRNLAHIAAIPQIMAGGSQPDAHSMLLLGNSLINNGVAAPLIADALPGVSVAKVTPDATTLWDWQCLLDHQLIARDGVHFETVVIGFAWNVLSDQMRSDASRLGGSYCKWSDLKRANTVGLQGSGDIGEFLAASVLRTYALRDTLRNRFFQLGVPSYAQFTRADNTAATVSTERSEEPSYSYRTLSGLVERLTDYGTRVILVAMPVQSRYDIDSQLLSLIDTSSLTLIDLRNVAGLDASHYLDEMHLNDVGQQMVSEALAEQLHAGLATPT